MLPLRPGLPARQTHDYQRNGTTTLFAALEVVTGRITAGACFPRHTSVEFLAFLKQVARVHPRKKLHVICDNHGTHTHPNVTAWLAKNTRITMHFTPTSCSWLNMARDLLRDHHPPSHPTRNLAQRRGPRRRHPPLHRCLQRHRHTIQLDQDRRRTTHEDHT